MRVLHLSAYDLFGGAAKAAFRLHTALANAGAASEMLVRRKDSDRADVHEPAGAARAWAKVQRRVERAFFLRSARGEFSPAALPDGLAGRVRALRPDLLHVHWVAHGFLRLETLAKLGLPVVWTMHDMWAFTGGCHYAGECARYERGCGRCPMLGSERERDVSSEGIRRRTRLVLAANIRFVAPSRWLAECAQRSSALGRTELCVIPNMIDTSIFSPRDQAAARRRLGLPVDARLVLAGAMDLGAGERKGLPEFWRALGKGLAGDGRQKLSQIVLFGTAHRRRVAYEGMVVHELGYLASESTMADAYAAADVFVAPSRQDNLPNTVMESLAVGTPVAGFRVGGIPDMVDDGINGLLATPGDVDGLAVAIARLLHDTAFRDQCGLAARETALRRFSPERVVPSYLELYARCLGRV